MIETLTTMVSLLLSAGAASVIGMTLWEDRLALGRALAGTPAFVPAPLPPHTHRVAAARRARIVRMDVSANGTRVAA